MKKLLIIYMCKILEFFQLEYTCDINKVIETDPLRCIIYTEPRGKTQPQIERCKND